MFEAFDAGVTTRARRAVQLARQAARLARQLQAAAEAADLHTLRQKVRDAVDRAAEAQAALGELERAVNAYALSPAATEVAATAADVPEQAYAAAFEQACAAAGVRLEGAYPDYRVFPFDVRIRLAEERAVVNRKPRWPLRPEVLARAVRRERDRVHGASFVPERFGAALVRCYQILLPEVQRERRSPAQQVPLRRALEILQLGTFGRHSYSRDQFVFDLYRFRQSPMEADGHRIVFEDVRDRAQAFEVPNGRGGHDRLSAFRAVPVEAAAEGRASKVPAAPAGGVVGDAR